jgi:large conductance mechanosensitive channel
MKREEPVTPTTKECPHCFTTIPLKAARCPNCTSQL